MNRISFDETERTQARYLKKALQLLTAAESCCSPFTIHAMRSKGAAGPDDIPPTFLKALGPMAKTELLSIFNESFFKGIAPGISKVSHHSPAEKAGKPAGAISPYRPVSLTSCVVKTRERMVHNRLYNLAETGAWLCSEQAGFRKLRSCEAQILRITQTISDGFQAAKPQRSLMAILDFSKAFDRVWNEELLLAASSKGIPIPFARWLHDFLSNRTARVQINGERGYSAPQRQGPPQGVDNGGGWGT